MSLAMTEASLKKRYHPGYVPETPPNFGPAGAPNGPPDNGRGPPPTGPPTTPNYASGLVPNSPPNYASFSPKDPVTIQQGSPQMTTVYPDSTVASFNLHSFFYGCTTDKSLPASCDITITGFNLTDDQISEQTFTFEADGAEQQMREAVAEGFSNVKWVNFDIGPEDQEARAYIDSVDYEVFGLDS